MIHVNDRLIRNNPVISESTTVVSLPASSAPNELNLVDEIRTALGAVTPATSTGLVGVILSNNGAGTAWLRNSTTGAGTGVPIPPASQMSYLPITRSPLADRLVYEAAANAINVLCFFEE